MGRTEMLLPGTSKAEEAAAVVDSDADAAAAEAEASPEAEVEGELSAAAEAEEALSEVVEEEEELPLEAVLVGFGTSVVPKTSNDPLALVVVAVPLVVVAAVVVVSLPAALVVDDVESVDDEEEVSALPPESPAVPLPPELFDVSMESVHDLTSSKASFPFTLMGVRTTSQVSVIKPIDVVDCVTVLKVMGGPVGSCLLSKDRSSPETGAPTGMAIDGVRFVDMEATQRKKRGKTGRRI
jgi:hypothetical protein